MRKIILPLVCGFITLSGVWFLTDIDKHSSYKDKEGLFEENEENEEEAGRRRDYYEWFISRDPNTGKIPKGIRSQEAEWVKTVAFRRSGIQSALVNNNYWAVGPSQRGGRTRALAFDVRYNGTSNRVVLSGGVQGGIFRSTDGGITWTFVHPANEVRSVTCIAQDPRPGNQDTWYAGTGESIGSSSYPNALVLGHGMFKSTDNGLTWTKLSSTVGTTNEFTYDSDFDFTTSISVHPVTGHVYVAGDGAILRSQNGGTSWQYALRSNSTNTLTGVTDVLINKSGSRLYAAFSGRNTDRPMVGVWTSTTGDPNTWTRVAGGAQGQTDSVPGWRAHDSRMIDDSDAGWGRVVMGLSANEDLYVLVENNKKSGSGVSEADLFRATSPTGTPFSWSANLAPALVAKRNGTTDNWFAVQNGYDMEVIGHPTNNNIIYVGGVTLIRSTDRFQTTANSYFMGGNIGSQVSSTYDDPDRVSHVDYHRLRFDPSNPNRMIAASDGALAVTSDATAAKVVWANASVQMLTMQYYHVGIDPRSGSKAYIGGTQDNGTWFRDGDNIFSNPKVDSNDQIKVLGGDGAQAFLFRNSANQYYMLGSVQEQVMYRVALFGTTTFDIITPENIEKERFVTYYHLDEDNPNYLYFPSNDTLYRTTSTTSVTPSTWTRVTGVDQLLTGQIFSMATTRGPYSTGNMLYMGTANGKIFRLRDPANTTTAAPVDITPGGMPNNVVVIDISVNPRSHDTIMAVVSNYNAVSVYWTGNATAASPTWQAVEGNVSLPSVRSCEIIATTSGVEYYVGTTVGLFSTRTISDASTNWTRENGGGGMMNTSIVQSLASRWRDNTLLVGTHGNGMFATVIGNAISGPTGVNDPIRDDKNFIVTAYPTITSNLIKYQAGTMLNIRSIQVQVFGLGGQLLYNQTSPYGSGQVDVGRLPSGSYILTITSNDRKYQFVRRFTKN